ncbi:MAG: aspartyl protease family protein [Gallionellaceae bacterium]|nr:aspartyl protease family protein [Gallionellaceae bacterium]
MANGAFDLTRADEAYRQGNFVEAEALYREALAQDSASASALKKLGNIALWKNDLEDAEKFLKAAQQHQSWLDGLWPMSAPINIHLAQTYARSGRMRDAAELYGRAAGWLPFGPFKELRLRSEQLKLFADETPYRISGDADTVIPFEITDPLPVVRISINGAEAANFFIDTGGEGLILDAGFAKQAGAQIVGESSQEYAGGKQGLTGFGKVERVELGGIAVNQVPVGTLDLTEISNSIFPGHQIKGILGTGLLQRFIATLDYRNKRLILRQPLPNRHAVDLALHLTESDHEFPIWLVETHLIFAQGAVNRLPPSLMLIDTGLADGGFLASQSIMQRAGVDMDWSQVRQGEGGGGKLKVLNVTIDEVALGNDPGAVRNTDIQGIVFEKDNSLFSGALGFEVGGLISHQFFRDHALTFDFANMRIILQ